MTWKRSILDMMFDDWVWCKGDIQKRNGRLETSERPSLLSVWCLTISALVHDYNKTLYLSFTLSLALQGMSTLTRVHKYWCCRSCAVCIWWISYCQNCKLPQDQKILHPMQRLLLHLELWSKCRFSSWVPRKVLHNLGGKTNTQLEFKFLITLHS